MNDEVLKRDQNHITVLGGVTDDADQDIVMLRVDPISKRLLVAATGGGSSGLVVGTTTITGGVNGELLYNNNGILGTIAASGTGTVTSVSVVSANGFAGTVATATTTPAITISTTITGLIKGNGTAISAATSNVDYQAPITLTTVGSSGVATFDGTTLNIPEYTSGGGGTFVDNEIVAGNTNTFTLANTPALGTEHIYAAGQRLYPTVGYTISGAVITTIFSWSTGDILADYQM